MSPPKIETLVVCPLTSSLDAILHFKLQCIKDKSVFIDSESVKTLSTRRGHLNITKSNIAHMSGATATINYLTDSILAVAGQDKDGPTRRRRAS